MMLSWELGRRYLQKTSGILSLSSGLSVFGMSLGVASMLVSMAVVSGYDFTLRKAVVDLTGHLVLTRVGGWRTSEELREVLEKVPERVAVTPYIYAEGALVHGGKLSGVLLEGVDEATVHSVLELNSRLREGEISFRGERDQASVILGKVLAEKHGLKVGDTFRLAQPQGLADRSRAALQLFRVSGIMDLGRYDYNSRMILGELRAIRAFAGLGTGFTGARLRVESPEQALAVAFRLRRELEPEVRVRTWRDVNANLFDAFEIEKPVIFFVLLVMVVAASFNIATTVFVSVFRRYRDISILKAMGARRSTILWLFSFQGLWIGLMGNVLGAFFAVFLGKGFEFAQKRWTLLPGEVYKIDHVTLDWRLGDAVMVFVAAGAVSLLASLGPAWRGSRLPPVAGLRYE